MLTNVDDVPLLQLALIRNTVADHFVDRPAGHISITIYVESTSGDIRADGFWELAVVQGRRVCVPFYRSVMAHFVQEIGRNARLDVRRRDVENLAPELTGWGIQSRMSRLI